MSSLYNGLYAGSSAFRSFRVLPAGAFKEHGWLSRSKIHLAVMDDWSDEAAPLQAFGEEAQSITISPQRFYLITPTSVEDEQVSEGRTILQDVLDF